MILQLGRSGTPPKVQEGWLDLQVQDAAGEAETQRLHLRCDIEPMGQRLQVRGEIRGSAGAHCHRCLAACERTVEADFTLVLQRGGEAGEDVVVVGELDDAFDLVPYVREAVILEEPIRVLCRSDCRGLCAQCGADLNAAACGCKPPVPPHWEPLRDLSKRLEP
jgi:uncharacterized protein